MSGRFSNYFQKGLGLILMMLTTVFYQQAQAQFMIEFTSCQLLELKGPVKHMEVSGFCQGPVTSILPVDTSVCKESYDFDQYGRMTYYAFYDRLGECSRRTSVEYTVNDEVSLYVNFQFGDTISFMATFNLLGQKTSYIWKKNGKQYQYGFLKPMTKKGKVRIEHYEKEKLANEIVEVYNKSLQLVSEEIKDVKTGKVSTRKLTYMDTLLLADEGTEQTMINRYDEQRRLIYTSVQIGEEKREVLFTYNPDSTMASMVNLETGKSSDKFVFEYNEKKQVILTKQYFDEYTLVMIESYEYDESGNLIKTSATENLGSSMEKTTELAYKYDYMGNWVEQVTTVTMGSSSKQSVTRRAFTYY